MAPAAGETVGEAVDCLEDAPIRSYDIVAMPVTITLNRYGDHDPQGRAYVLESEVERVRAEAARGADGVSLGLQGDAVQPLVLRATPGDCLVVRLSNGFEDEPASFHLHSSSLVVASTGEAATAANPDAMAPPGGMVTYAWSIPEEEPEGSRIFHSHGDARTQSAHGLFGTLVVEPAGSEWFDPRTGRRGTTGWDAVVRAPDGHFREFVLAYHEVGDEEYRIATADGGELPQIDPLTQAYRPGARALNYRSEPFLNRLQLQQATTGTHDESLAYSSYTFGDPATPILRAYVGEPVKQRVVHGGSEVHHVHHVHGGSVRWRRQPRAGDTGFGSGLTKQPALLPGPSERIDSQTIGPSEAHDVEHECSAGGCQQGAGDHLVHCHIAHHYFAGMWGIWRVYNTLQDGSASTDALPPLADLRDRAGAVSPAVELDDLDTETVAKALRHLPPPGRPDGYDATVWDWVEEDGRILGEPEDQRAWPGHEPVRPGVRTPVRFATDGRPAFPILRPRLGARPPFAPGHGPAPYLDVPRPDGGPSPPGADGPRSLCPAGTELRTLMMRAIQVPVPLDPSSGIVDPTGVLFVLAEEEARVRAEPDRRTPLAVRANAGEHCVDVVLTNAIPDDENHPFSKVSAHIHFVQFDVQGGDGVDTGFNFEQSVRPYTEGARTLTGDALAGARSVTVGDTSPFRVGAFVAVGIDDAGRLEIRKVTTIDGRSLGLDRPLSRDHAAGQLVGMEFVRYRWYPDAQVGTSYFHDHVNGIQTWQRGLVGALVVEPPGSTYHDPQTGAELRSGPIADIRAPADRAVAADIRGSFRELVSFVQDGSRLSNVGRSAGSKLNLRAEPLAKRPGDRARVFSSRVHGDPETPLLRAYVGDPVVVRVTVSGTNEVHTWHVDGHWFRREAWSQRSSVTSTAHLGISERTDLALPAAGGPQRRAGDYLYSDGRALKLEEGAWGLLRVHPGPAVRDLEALPGREPPDEDPPPVCPADAPRRRSAISAVEAHLPMLAPKRGRAFVPDDQVDAVRAGGSPASPLVLRASVGDCLQVRLTNRLPTGSGAVSLHADGLAYDPLSSGGIEAGRNPPQVVAEGASRTFTFYAHPEFGPGAAILRDGGDLAGSGASGLYGAVVISPEGARFDPGAGWVTTVTGPDGEAWRDAVLFLHDSDDSIGSHRMPYNRKIRGVNAVNHRTGADIPSIEAHAGDPLRIHVLAPWSEQAQVFSIEGHRWPLEPAMSGTTVVDSVTIGGLESITVVPERGAGGPDALPGTYRFGNHREPYREAMTGRLVVLPRCADDTLKPLPSADSCTNGTWVTEGLVASVLVAGVLGGAVLWRRRTVSGRGISRRRS